MKNLNSIPANTKITLVEVDFFAVVMLVNYITWFA